MNSPSPNAPLVSVAIPLYNTAEYLRECLESLLAQTYRNWQAVIVDNVSTDGSGAIADEFAARDPRITVLHCHRFLDQNANYNRAVAEGLKTGRYLKILEPDNWLYPECLEQLVRRGEETPAAPIIGAYYLHGTEVEGDGLPPAQKEISGREVCRLTLLNDLYVFGMPTSILYRSDAIRRLQPVFDPQAFHDDTDLCYRMLKDSSFAFVHQVLSGIRRGNEGELSRTGTYNPHLLSHCIFLKKYGQDYLSDTELTSVEAFWTSRYYRYLGRSLLAGRNRDFWAFHARWLATVGLRVRTGRVFASAFLVLIDHLLNPKRSLERLLRRRNPLRSPGGRRLAHLTS